MFASRRKRRVFLTQIVGGKMQKVNLCEACSKEKGVNDPTGFALADLLLGMGAAQDIERSPNGITCPVCGFTQADFKKTGRLGCSACYDVFGDSLESMLKNMHKGSRACRQDARLALAKPAAGCPHQAPANQSRTSRRRRGDEKAADLRDQIRRIEGSQRV